MKVVTRPSATMHKAMEIQDSNKEDEEGVGMVRRLLEVVIEVNQTTWKVHK